MKSWKTPTSEQVSRAVALLRRVEQYRYFFDRLENPLWLRPLLAKGFFTNPPDPVRDESKRTISFPPWPESRYLARMAATAPDVVLEIALGIPETGNTRVHEDLVEAALAMAPHLSVRLAERAAGWLDSPYHSLLPEKVGQLVVHLSKGGQIESALRLTRALLVVLPDPQAAEESDEDRYRFPPEPRGRFDVWNYRQILKRDLPRLVKAAGRPALDLLCDLLETAIHLSRLGADAAPPEDYSYVWRPAVEEHSQNLSLRLKDALFAAVRDAAEQLARESPGVVPTLVAQLEARPWYAFHRVALHLLRLFPEAAPSLVAERLTDRATFDNLTLHHEYVHLLRAGFSRLTPNEQGTILTWIEASPEREQFRTGFQQLQGVEPSDADYVRYAEAWRRDKMALLGDALPAELRDLYEELVAKHGTADHADFVSYHSAVWHGPTSPKTVQNLQSMSVEEVTSYLKNWTPPGGFTDPTPEGLGRVLGSLVAADPQRFTLEAEKFKLDEPTYVRSILQGFREATGHGRTFDWSPVLALSAWAAGHPREVSGELGPHGDRDPHWGWTRKTIAELLSAGFAEGAMELPLELRQRSWEILSLIIEDPDPTPSREADYSRDPATLSINTTRGEAMHSVIKYALWVRRHLQKLPDGAERLARGLGEMPEVRSVLEYRLKPENEASLAIRSVYGQWFPWIGLIDKTWAGEYAALIFPAQEESHALWEAAWETYVRFCAPFDDTFGLLSSQYRLAVSRIREPDDRRGIDAPESRLTEHLMTFYWRGKLALDDREGLLAHFYALAPVSLRAHAIEFIGRSLYETKGAVETTIVDRFKALWASRLEWVRASNDFTLNAGELVGFGWWFASGKFEVDWAMSQLNETMKLAGKAELDDLVAERLASLAPEVPAQAVECLALLVEADKEGWGILGWAEHAKRVLIAALVSNDTNAQQSAVQLVHRLGARGRHEFRDLLALGGQPRTPTP